MKKRLQKLKPNTNTVKTLCNALQCSPIKATILINRGIVSVKEAHDFFNPSLKNLRMPNSIKGMDTAVKRIFNAIKNKEKILIFGDYDVDGITSTTILLEFFHQIGANASYYIPHRIKEGYSLKRCHIENYALPNKVNLIITVDCGSDSYEAVEAAKNIGIDIIITDHHKISNAPPEALAIINPKQSDCNSKLDNLAGVGVAFYLLIYLRKYLRRKNFWQNKSEPNLKNLCDLVAFGTVADMVPIVNENRILIKAGLEIINSKNRHSIRALTKICSINDRLVTVEDIAFRLAPRLNAAGRMQHASNAVELLRTDNFENALKSATSLNDINAKRRDIGNDTFKQIQAYLTKNPFLLEKKSIVLSHHNWHEGVLGIVASNLVEKYFRPVVLIATNNGIGKGSARSIPCLDIHEGLLECSDNFEAFGGHAMAAGLTIKNENINAFQKKFENIVCKMTTSDNFEPIVFFDYELNFDDISDQLIDEIESMQPFGTGFKEPLFIARNINVLSSKIVGKNHRRMFLKQNGSKTNKSFNAMHFNVDVDKNESVASHFDCIAFKLKWNRWNSSKTAQIIIEEI